MIYSYTTSKDNSVFTVFPKMHPRWLDSGAQGLAI